MTKAIILDPALCTNCRLCSVVCSVKKEGVSDLTRSRVQVVVNEMAGVYLPVFCRQCEDPSCVAACPVEALEQDASGLIVPDEEACTGCEECVSACPYGGVRWHDRMEKTLVCDLCGGDPECTKFCFTRAITYQESNPEQQQQARDDAGKLLSKITAETVTD